MAALPVVLRTRFDPSVVRPSRILALAALLDVFIQFTAYGLGFIPAPNSSPAKRQAVANPTKSFFMRLFKLLRIPAASRLPVELISQIVHISVAWISQLRWRRPITIQCVPAATAGATGRNGGRIGVNQAGCVECGYLAIRDSCWIHITRN